MTRQLIDTLTAMPGTLVVVHVEMIYDNAGQSATASSMPPGSSS
jgi:hypothetical protein